MSRRQANVLVEVKGLNLWPLDVRRLRQGIEELKLRRGSGGDDPGMTVLRNRAANRGRGLLRSGASQRDFIFEYFEQHTDLFWPDAGSSRAQRTCITTHGPGGVRQGFPDMIFGLESLESLNRSSRTADGSHEHPPMATTMTTTTLTRTTPGFLTEDFLLSNDAARRLYHEFAAPQPILDYHCHLSPQDISENRRFRESL